MEVPHDAILSIYIMTPKYLLIVTLLMVMSCNNQHVTEMPEEQPLNIADSINAMNASIHHVGDMLKSSRGWYFIDRSSVKLVQTDPQFNLIREYSAKGRGPHELSRPLSITIAENFIFLIDGTQRKIVQFDFELNPVNERVLAEHALSILALNDSLLWFGSLHHDFEDVYQYSIPSANVSRIGVSKKVNLAIESIVFHVNNRNGHILRYRPFGHSAEVYYNGTLQKSFKNVTQPEFPELDIESPVPMYKTKTHNIAFLTESRACFLSGDVGPRRQPIQCFDFDGNLVSRYVIPTPSPFAVYSDSLLYTYSPETNHIYVYNLGF